MRMRPNHMGTILQILQANLATTDKNSKPRSKVSNTRTPSARTHFPPLLKKLLPRC